MISDKERVLKILPLPVKSIDPVLLVELKTSVLIYIKEGIVYPNPVFVMLREFNGYL